MTQKDSNQYPNLKGDSITNEINSLRRKVLDIMTPYRRPISSILPEERQVENILLFDEETDSEAYYDRFSSWEGSISKKKIRDWLNQFETTMDKNIAHLLLSKFQFLSKSNIEVATRNLQAKLLNLLFEHENLRQAFRSEPKAAVKDEAEMQKWLRNKVIHYARLPNPPDTAVESQDRLWGVYERFALTEASVPNGKKFKPLEEYFKASSSEPETSVFVFMDYTNGSGNQLSKCLREINKLLSKYPEWQKSLFVFMYVVQAELFRIEDIELRPQKSLTLFYEAMLHYKSTEIMKILSDNQITEAEYDDFIERYCLRATGKPSVGYRQSGALTCHHYSCPNNTLPFFHSPNKNWEPLFRKSQTPSATRYKQK
ncbi:MAG TPA: hypothetical protein DCE56_21925 [Cyanobacteria bacterium UBA8553]|nr:hypothetical protein [Cyanobacteria bacterium UBA8553]HAJ62303.1 hypothetical protein [Cyanobacteria bacterium UBA8543]